VPGKPAGRARSDTASYLPLIITLLVLLILAVTVVLIVTWPAATPPGAAK
jgi:hypothetical protein